MVNSRVCLPKGETAEWCILRLLRNMDFRATIPRRVWPSKQAYKHQEATTRANDAKRKADWVGPFLASRHSSSSWPNLPAINLGPPLHAGLTGLMSHERTRP